MTNHQLQSQHIRNHSAKNMTELCDEFTFLPRLQFIVSILRKNCYKELVILAKQLVAILDTPQNISKHKAFIIRAPDNMRIFISIIPIPSPKPMFDHL